MDLHYSQRAKIAAHHEHHFGVVMNSVLFFAMLAVCFSNYMDELARYR